MRESAKLEVGFNICFLGGMQGAEDEDAGSVPKYITKPKSDSNAADWPLWHAATSSH